MSFEHRLQMIARIAYAVAFSDGRVHPEERRALAAILQHHFPIYEQNEIMHFFKDFEETNRTTGFVLDDGRIRKLHTYLFKADNEKVLEMVRAIADSFEGVHPSEQVLLDKLEAKLSS